LKLISVLVGGEAEAGDNEAEGEDDEGDEVPAELPWSRSRSLRRDSQGLK